MKHFFTTTLRLLKVQWFLTLINVIGLTIGIMCAIFIFLWVQDERSYDKIHPESDRIYRVESLMDFESPTLWTVAPDPIAEAIKADFPEVEESVKMKSGYKITISNGEDNFFERGLYYVSPSFFEMFHFPISKQKALEALEDPFSLLISETLSKKYFGDDNPIGQSLKVNNKYTFTITGTFPDYPDNSHLKIDFLAPYSTLKSMGEELGKWGRFDYLTYVKLKAGTDVEVFRDKILDYTKRYDSRTVAQLQLQSLENIHLFSQSGTGSISKVRIISLIGILILMIAFINFINISTSLAIQRHKEIAIRKTVGASRKEIVNQIYYELGFLTLIAGIISIVATAVLLPIFNDFIGKQIVINTFFSYNIILPFIALMLVTVMLSGLYPAAFLSSFQPIDLLNRTSSSRHSSRVRKFLVILQFSISVVLIMSTLVIHNQFRFMKNMDLGFSKENQMFIQIPRAGQDKLDVIKNRFSQIIGEDSYAVSNRVLANMGTFNHISKWDGNTDNTSIMVNEMKIDHQFISLLDMEIIEGRDFRQTESAPAVIINQEAAAKMGFENPVGKRIFNNGEYYEVVGMLKNFHFKPLKSDITPIILYFSQDGSYINLKVNPTNLASTIKALEHALKEVLPESPFSYGFLAEKIDSYYSSDKDDGKIIKLFSLLAILTSCLGILGLASFLAQSKTKEIGIRKTMGASKWNVVMRLVKEILVLVILSGVIGGIAGRFVMTNWLNNYAYRIEVGVLHFTGALAISLILAIATISFHAWRSASINPVEALRKE